MKIIGIIGTRRKDGLEHFKKVEEVLKRIITPEDQICSGFCPQGGDRFAVILATHYGNLKPLWFPPDWKGFGKAAGFKRNTDIAMNSDVLIAVVADDRTGGTEDTIRKFKHFHPNTEMNGNLHLIV